MGNCFELEGLNLQGCIPIFFEWRQRGRESEKYFHCHKEGFGHISGFADELEEKISGTKGQVQ